MTSDEKQITPDQCRAARAMLGWSRDKLAVEARVGPATLADFEAGKRSPYQRTLADIQTALEAAGIQFIPQDTAGPGVRWRAPKP
ncbi:helix-turn-helix domain-containing protein [Azospirillum argentinense]